MLFTLGDNTFLDELTNTNPKQRTYTPFIRDDYVTQTIRIYNDCFYPNAVWAHSLVGSDKTSKVDKIIRTLQRAAGNKMDNRTLQRRAKFETAKIYNDVIDNMIESGLIKKEIALNKRGSDTVYYSLINR